MCVIKKQTASQHMHPMTFLLALLLTTKKQRRSILNQTPKKKYRTDPSVPGIQYIYLHTFINATPSPPLPSQNKKKNYLTWRLSLRKLA